MSRARTGIMGGSVVVCRSCEGSGLEDDGQPCRGCNGEGFDVDAMAEIDARVDERRDLRGGL